MSPKYIYIYNHTDLSFYLYEVFLYVIVYQVNGHPPLSVVQTLLRHLLAKFYFD